MFPFFIFFTESAPAFIHHIFTDSAPRPLRIFYWIGPFIWNVDLSDLTSSLIHLECLDYSFFWINICILNLDDLGDLTSSIWILKATAPACQALFLNVDIYKYIWMGESAPVSKLRSGVRRASWIGLLRTSLHKMFFL